MSKDVGRACKTVLLFVMFSLLAEPEKAFAIGRSIRRMQR